MKYCTAASAGPSTPAQGKRPCGALRAAGLRDHAVVGMLRLTAARRPATLGQAVGRRTVADDGSGAGLDGRHTGKYRRAYEFMVSSRHASCAASPLVRQR